MNGACLCLLLLLSATRLAAEDLWVGSLSSGARLRSMGGVFAASSEAGDALLFNPAALARQGASGFGLELGPLAPVNFRPSQAKRDWGWSKALPALSALRRVEWRGGGLGIALGAVEWLPDSIEAYPKVGERATPASTQLVPTLALALAMDERVRLGGAMSLWFDSQKGRRRPGLSYGVIIRANRHMDVGAQAAYFPAGAAASRPALDRMGDGAINVGVAWRPLGRPGVKSRASTLLVAVDVRNVTQDAGLAGRQELHLGAEALWRGQLAARAGVQWPNQEQDGARPCASWGLGWQGRILRGAVHADLGLMQDPLRGGHRLWMAGLGWSP